MVDALEAAIYAATAVATLLLVVVTFYLFRATRGLEKATGLLAQIAEKDLARKAPFLRVEETTSSGVFWDEEESRLMMQVSVWNSGQSPTQVRAIRVTEELIEFYRDEDGIPGSIKRTYPGGFEVVPAARFNQSARLEAGERITFTAELKEIGEPNDAAGYNVVLEAEDCPNVYAWLRLHHVRRHEEDIDILL